MARARAPSSETQRQGLCAILAPDRIQDR